MIQNEMAPDTDLLPGSTAPATEGTHRLSSFRPAAAPWRRGRQGPGPGRVRERHLGNRSVPPHGEREVRHGDV